MPQFFCVCVCVCVCALPLFQTPQDAQANLVFPLTQSWTKPVFQGVLVAFIGEWQLENKFWVLAVLIATGISLF